MVVHHPEDGGWPSFESLSTILLEMGHYYSHYSLQYIVISLKLNSKGVIIALKTTNLSCNQHHSKCQPKHYQWRNNQLLHWPQNSSKWFPKAKPQTHSMMGGKQSQFQVRLIWTVVSDSTGVWQKSLFLPSRDPANVTWHISKVCKEWA